MLSTILLVLAAIFVSQGVIAIMIGIGWFLMIVIVTLMEKILLCFK